MAGTKPRVMSGGGSTVAEAFSGHVFDDGTFATAAVTPEWLQQERAAIMRLRKTFGAQREAPELAIARWLQTDAPLPLPKLKNENVVLLDFWGVWCQPCIAHMPALAALREAIRDERFVIIGVHSVTGADTLDAFLARNRYPVPIAVDTGETATRYAVTNWPTYVLIDKSGHVISYGSELPAAAQIENLLR
jgi:thiol-disulfide isomerase/thioredoxin